MKHTKHKNITNKIKKLHFKQLLHSKAGLLVGGLLVVSLVGLPLALVHFRHDCQQAVCSNLTAGGHLVSAGSVQCNKSPTNCSSGGGKEAQLASEAKKTEATKQQAAKAAEAAKAAAAEVSAAPVTTPAPLPTPVTSHISSKYGIAAGSVLTRLSGTDLASQLDGMRAMGVGWVRFDVQWSTIEATQGNYSWGATDAVVKGITARGMRVLGVIDYTPAWARPGGCGNDKCAPADPANYANFAGVVASRYSGYGVAAYEIWNEPNSVDFYKPSANVVQYTQLLSAAYQKIKAASPSSLVITGGTSPRDTGSGNLSPIDFVQGLYNSGAKNYFDAIGAHPYTFPATAAYPSLGNAWGQLETFRSIMVANGDAGKQVWSTEYGAPTGGPGPTATIGNLQIGSAWHVDEPLQAQSVSDAIRINSDKTWKGPLLWYAYKDAGSTQDTNENFFGLIRADGSHKPAYDSFVQALAAYN